MGEQDSLGLPAPELTRRVVRGSMWTLLAYGVNLPLGLVSNLVIARLLGPVEFGHLAALYIVITLAGTASDLGSSAALLQYGTTFETLNQRPLTEQLFSSAQGLRLLLQLPIGVVVGVFVLRDLQPGLIFIYLLTAALTVVLTGPGQLFQCRNSTADVARVNLVASVLANAVAVSAALLGESGAEVFVWRSICGVIAPVALLWLLTPSDRLLVLRAKLPRDLPAGFWRFALPTWGAGVVGMVVFSRSEVLLLRNLGQAQEAGVFALAFGLALQVTAPLDSLAPVVAGATTSAHSSRPDQVDRVVYQVVSLFSLVLGPVLIVAACAPQILPLVFGSKYQGLGLLFLPLLGASALQTLAHPVQAYAFASRSGRALLLANASALVVDLALVLALAPTWGAWGAVAANISAQICALAILTVVAVRAVPLAAGRLCRAAGPVLLALVMLAAYAVPGPWQNPSPSGVVELAGLTIVGLVAWVALVRRLRLGPAREELERLLKHLPVSPRRVSVWVVSLLNSRVRPVDS